jgi:hypothetical protein
LVQYLPRWNDIDFIAFVLKEGRDAGFIRPSHRIRIQTPEINQAVYLALPPSLILEREPRYAGRRCSSNHRFI